MKKVKFNASTSILMIPEAKYDEYKAKMELLREDEFDKFLLKLQAGNPFQFKNVEIGDIVDVPDWYYQAHKNRTATQGNSFDIYKDKGGNLTPFDTQEAVRHGDMNTSTETMKTVKLFELVSK